MKSSISLVILASSIILSVSIYFAGQNGRYVAGAVGDSGIYILDSKTGDIRTCLALKLLKDDECWTMKEMQGR